MVYLLANKREHDDERVKTIKTQEDIDWSSNLILALREIQEPNIIILLEDTLFHKKVDGDIFKKILHDFEESSGVVVNLKSRPAPIASKTKEYFGEIPCGVPYRAALSPCLWKRSFLLSLLKEGESAWEFEKRVSKEMSENKGFFSTYNVQIHLHHLMVKGKITRQAESQFLSESERLKLSIPTNSIGEELVLMLKGLRFYLFKVIVPFRYQARIYNILRG